MRAIEKEFYKFTENAKDAVLESMKTLDNNAQIVWLLQMLVESDDENNSTNITLKGIDSMIKLSFTRIKKELEEQEYPEEMIEAQLDLMAMTLATSLFDAKHRVVTE